MDTSGQLSGEAIDDVCGAVADYIALYEELEAEKVVAIATSAVRDAQREMQEAEISARARNASSPRWGMDAPMDRPSTCTPHEDWGFGG